MNVKKSIVIAPLCFVFLALQWLTASTALATTKWWKIAPNGCAINVTGSDLTQTVQYTTGPVAIATGLQGGVSVYLYCPVFLPHGVSANKLRIRAFQSGGLPINTDLSVTLKRLKWDSSISTLATADLDSSDTYADADFTSTIDNENYEYFLVLYLYKNSSAETMPQLDMIEIRYDE